MDATAMLTTTALTDSQIRGKHVSMRVLLIDDDARLFELLASYLEQNGVTVTGARDGDAGPRGCSRRAAFDAVLLDVMMPGIDGLEVCKRIRAKSNIPVAHAHREGRRDGPRRRPRARRRRLHREALQPARAARAASRRAFAARSPRRPASGSRPATSRSTSAGREVTRGTKRVDLTGIEFDILVALVRRAGRVVPRDSLLSEAGRGDVVVGERTVDVHISHLRQKLGDDPKAPRLIKTVRGVGYVLSKD